MLFMHPRMQCNIFRRNSFYWIDFKRNPSVLIACFMPRIKDRSRSVPTNCTRLGLMFHLGKQKKNLIWKQWFSAK